MIGSSKPRMLFSSSLANRVSGVGEVRSPNRLAPFSMIVTSQPASASTMAAVDPPGPLPTTIGLSHRASVVELGQEQGDDARRIDEVEAVGAAHLVGV